MRSIFQFKSLFILLAGIFIFDSCTTDETPMFVTEPTILLNDGIDVISADATVPAGAMFFVSVTGTKGDNDMNTFTVQRDGSNIDPSEITIDGETNPPNPKLLFDADRASFTFEVGIMPHATGDALYTFIADGDGDGTQDVVNITISIDDADPTASIVGSGAFTAEVGTVTGLTLSADGMGTDISTVGFYKEGVLMDIADVAFDGIDIPENPVNLVAGQTSFTDVPVTIRQGNEFGIKNYTIVVTTASGKSVEVAYTIEVVGVDAEFTAVLLENAAGTNLTGGINLYEGETVSVNAANAYLIDLGNDAVPSWRQQIGGDNGCTLKAMSQAQMDSGLTYASINSNAVVKTAFDEGSSLSNNESGVVAVGDVFFANVSNDYFAVECTEIGTDMGLGFYRFSIKKAEDQ